MINFLSVSTDGLALTKSCEGCQLTAYQDPVGIWTIGYGHTGPDVYKGLVIAQDRADYLLELDLKSAAKTVCNLTTVKLTQNQIDALTDFVFNLGAEAFRTSTLLKCINAGDMDGAAKEFGKWNKAGGKVLPGLTKRRAAEAALFTKA